MLNIDNVTTSSGWGRTNDEWTAVASEVKEVLKKHLPAGEYKAKVIRKLITSVGKTGTCEGATGLTDEMVADIKALYEAIKPICDKAKSGWNYLMIKISTKASYHGNNNNNKRDNDRWMVKVS